MKGLDVSKRSKGVPETLDGTFLMGFAADSEVNSPGFNITPEIFLSLTGFVSSLEILLIFTWYAGDLEMKILHCHTNFDL